MALDPQSYSSLDGAASPQAAPPSERRCEVSMKRAGEKSQLVISERFEAIDRGRWTDEVARYRDYTLDRDHSFGEVLWAAECDLYLDRLDEAQAKLDQLG